MAKGDHIRRRISWTPNFHHGIDVGNGTVIHFWSHDSNKSQNMIQMDSMEAFSNGQVIEVVNSEAIYTPERIIKRAKSKLYEDNYSILWNNCEHFANWCRSGEAKSEQSDNPIKSAFDSISDWFSK